MARIDILKRISKGSNNWHARPIEINGIKYDYIAESPLIQPNVFNNIGFNILGNAITIVNVNSINKIKITKFFMGMCF